MQEGWNPVSSKSLARRHPRQAMNYPSASPLHAQLRQASKVLQNSKIYSSAAVARSKSSLTSSCDSMSGSSTAWGSGEGDFWMKSGLRGHAYIWERGGQDAEYPESNIPFTRNSVDEKPCMWTFTKKRRESVYRNADLILHTHPTTRPHTHARKGIRVYFDKNRQRPVSSLTSRCHVWVREHSFLVTETPVDFHDSGQITIFHQPRCPWKFRGFPFQKATFLGAQNSCEVAIIWPDDYN